MKKSEMTQRRTVGRDNSPTTHTEPPSPSLIPRPDSDADDLYYRFHHIQISLTQRPEIPYWQTLMLTLKRYFFGKFVLLEIVTEHKSLREQPSGVFTHHCVASSGFPVRET